MFQAEPFFLTLYSSILHHNISTIVLIALTSFQQICVGGCEIVTQNRSGELVYLVKKNQSVGVGKYERKKYVIKGSELT